MQQAYKIFVIVCSAADVKFSTKIAEKLSTKISSGKSQTTTETRTATTDIEYECPPMKLCTMRVQVYKAEINIPFNATIQRTGDYSFRFVEEGIWQSVQYGETQTELNIENSKCKL